MSLRARAFQIRNGEHGREDEDRLSSFLRGAQVDRIETAHADGAWQVLVLFQDDKASEESEQIASVIAGELRSWRKEMAKNLDTSPTSVLSDDLLEKVARYVPTTTLELRVVLGTDAEACSAHENEIVQVVRQAMDDLT